MRRREVAELAVWLTISLCCCSWCAGVMREMCEQHCSCEFDMTAEEWAAEGGLPAPLLNIIVDYLGRSKVSICVRHSLGRADARWLCCG